MDIAVTLQTGKTPYRVDVLKKIPVGNFGDSFNFTLQDSAAAALNITGLTPKFTLYRPNAQREVGQVWQKDCTITNGAGGLCSYAVIQGDFTTRTTYMARIELFTGSTKIDSTNDFLLEVV